MATAIPIAFWRREVLWRSTDGCHGSIVCDWATCARYPRAILKTNMADPRIAQWGTDDQAALVFLFWSRMPVAEPLEDRIVLCDQRFMQSPVRSNSSVTLRVPDCHGTVTNDCQAP